MNKFYDDNVAEYEPHELEELELFSVAMENLSFKYKLREAFLSYFIDIEWDSHYVAFWIAFKADEKHIFNYAINYHAADEADSVTIMEKNTDSMVDMVKDIDRFMAFLKQIK